MAFQGFSGKLQLRLSKALRDVYLEDDAFDTLLMQLDKRFIDFAVQSEPYPDRMKRVLEAAYKGGWLKSLVELARRDAAGDLELQAVELELQAKVKFIAPTSLNHFRACCLNGGHIMVDRDDLRDALEKFYDPRERRIVVVNDVAQPAVPGQRVKTGKTHTRKLISHLRQVRQDFRLVDIDLERIRDALKPPKLIMPADVAESILRQMKMLPLLQAPPGDFQWARWVLNFCDDFVTEMANETDTWIVIDSFNVVLVPPETQGLIYQLAQRINDTLGNVRMILLGYDGTLPEVRPRVDQVRPFEQKHLSEFFTRAFMEKERPFTEEDVVDAVMRVLEGADPAQPDFVVKAAPLILAELESRR